MIMKRFIILGILCLGISLTLNAQLIVDENGNVSVGYDGNSTLCSNFSINGNGSSGAAADIIESNRLSALHITKEGIGVSSYSLGIDLNTRVVNNIYACGIRANTNSLGTTVNSRACAVYGAGSGAASGYNYGVMGVLNAPYSYNGAGVYGSSVNNDMGILVGGKYAGYFNGNVYATGSIHSGAFLTTSDIRLKEDISPLKKNPLEALMEMNVIEFKYKQREVEAYDTIIKLYDEDSPIITHRHYGLIAQELQEIYPDLVIEDEDGYLAVNYVEIIPLLIQSIQELSAKLEAAEKSTGHRGETTAFNTTEVIETALFQNTPNPFTETTVIPCAVAEGVAQAVLYVYNLNGEQIAEYPIASRGDTEVTIEGNSLKAGMYLYSLIADGKVIDTKRMILTK